VFRFIASPPASTGASARTAAAISSADISV
jgi:hypothetical protein